MGETSYYTGYRFLANDVVLVIPNYRVNVLGFLSTGDEASTGNYGLKVEPKNFELCKLVIVLEKLEITHK